jgi:hypothetical protein
LPGKSDPDVISVVFLRSSLHTVSSVVIEKFSNLSFLDVSNSGITKGDENTLKNLDISDNDIATVRGGFLESCKNLKNVWIENNLITSVSPWNSLIKGSKTLRKFSFYNNLCVDESFENVNFSQAYEKTEEKPLRLCFENFLSGNEVMMPMSMRMRSARVGKPVRKIDLD